MTWTDFVILLKLLLMWIFPFYRDDFPINEIPETFQESYWGDDLPPPADPEKRHAEIVVFFKAEEHGWVYDINTYVPTYVLKSKGMTIIFHKNFVILQQRFPDGSPSIQMTKRTTTAFPKLPITAREKWEADTKDK